MTKNKNSKPITRTYIKRTVGLSIALSFVQEMSCMNLQTQLTNLTNQLNQLTKSLTSSVSMTNKPDYESLIKTHEELKQSFNEWQPSFKALFESPDQKTFLIRSDDLLQKTFKLYLAASQYQLQLVQITNYFTQQLPSETQKQLSTFSLKKVCDLLNEQNNNQTSKNKFEKILDTEILNQKNELIERFLNWFKTMQMNEEKALNVQNLTRNPTKNPTTPTPHSTPVPSTLTQSQKNVP